MNKNVYPPELKYELYKRYEQGESVLALSQHFGPQPPTIYKWFKQIRAEQLQMLTENDKKLEELIEETKELKRQQAFLKKAAAWFDEADKNKSDGD